MPTTLWPVSRRAFLGGAVAGAAGLLLRNRLAFAVDENLDPNRVAILSDTHINADPTAMSRGVVMADHLKQVVAQVLKSDGLLPANVLINGDLAHVEGLEGDYPILRDGIAPFTAAGLPVHMTLGNHDNRDHFRTAFSVDDSRDGIIAVENKHVTAVETPRARILILDTLDKVNVTPGLVGELQLAWLSKVLDASPDRPTLIVMHHNPNLHVLDIGPTASTATRPAKPIGITDTEALMAVLLPRKQVKALLFGHLHHWARAKVDELHVVGLPAVSYVFEPDQPSGWVDCRLDVGGAKLMLRCIQANKATDGEVVDLRWRV
jgi:Icc protein